MASPSPTIQVVMRVLSRHKIVSLGAGILITWAVAKGVSSIILYLHRRSDRDPGDALFEGEYPHHDDDVLLSASPSGEDDIISQTTVDPVRDPGLRRLAVEIKRTHTLLNLEGGAMSPMNSPSSVHELGGFSSSGGGDDNDEEFRFASAPRGGGGGGGAGSSSGGGLESPSAGGNGNGGGSDDVGLWIDAPPTFDSPGSPRVRSGAGAGAAAVILGGGGSGSGSGSGVGAALAVSIPAAPPVAEIAMLLNLISHLGGTLQVMHVCALHARLTKRVLETGDVLFSRGDDGATGLYIVSEGRLGVSAGDNASEDVCTRGAAAAAQVWEGGDVEEGVDAVPISEEGPDGLLCIFGAGTTLGENNLLAGMRTKTSIGGGAWSVSADSTRAVTVRALERSVVLQIDAEAFSWFASTFPEAVISLVLDTHARLWRVSSTLLIDCLRLADAWHFSLEPPGSAPAFFFGSETSPPPLSRTIGGTVYPQPVMLLRTDIEAAADYILVLRPGEAAYAVGDPGDSVCLILDGFAYTTIARAPSLLSGTISADAASRTPAWRLSGAALKAAAPQGFPLKTLPKPILGGPHVVRLLGPGCISGGPACFNNMQHRESLIAVSEGEGTTVAFFSRTSFFSMTVAQAGAFSGGKNGGSSGGGGGGGGVDVGFGTSTSFSNFGTSESFGGGNVTHTPPGTPIATTIHQNGGRGGGGYASGPLGSPAPPPQPPKSPFLPPWPEAQTPPPKPQLQCPRLSTRSPLLLQLVLAVARSMSPLPRLLLSLGLNREWYRSGKCVFRRGDTGNGLFYLVSGRVRSLWATPVRSDGHPRFSLAANEGKPRPLFYLDVGQGETVGELSVLAREAVRTSTAVAARDCEVVHISGASFALLAARYPSVFSHFTALLARRFQELTRQLIGGSVGTPGLLGVEAAIGIPYSLPAPPVPTLSLGALRRGLGTRETRIAQASGPGAHGAPFAALPPATPPNKAADAWVTGHPGLVPRNPAAPTYRTIALVPAGENGVSFATLESFAARLARALARCERASAVVLTSRALDVALGDGASASLRLGFGRARASAWLGAQEEAHRFVILTGDAGAARGAAEWRKGVGADQSGTGAEGDKGVGRAGLSSRASQVSAWTSVCVAHADVVLLIADGAGGSGLSLEESNLIYFDQHKKENNNTFTPEASGFRLSSSTTTTTSSATATATATVPTATSMSSPSSSLPHIHSPSAYSQSMSMSPGIDSQSSSSPPRWNDIFSHVAVGAATAAARLRRVASVGGSLNEPSRLDKLPATASPVSPPPLHRTSQRKDLVLLHNEGVSPQGTRAWLRARRVAWHHHCTKGLTEAAAPPSGSWPTPSEASPDVDRLARFLCGRAIGVVLGGGGARGLAHIGLLQQMQAAGIPIDVIGGASQGSFVAAAWALTSSAPETASIVAKLARSLSSIWNFVTSLTLPLVSWTSGAHFDDVIRNTMGDSQIEDLPGARYFCVSLNATDGAIAVHSSGPLWRYVRASMSVLRLLPPVFDRDTHRLLVDGGYASNLPVDVMHAFLPGVVGLAIACDVESKDSNKTWLDIDARDFGKGDSLILSGFYVGYRVLMGKIGLGPPMRIPWIDDLFLQVSTL